MKKFIAIFCLMLAPMAARAQVVYYWDYPMFIGNLTTNVNQSYSNLLTYVQAASSNSVVVTQVSGSTNWTWWVSNSVIGDISYWNSITTNGTGGGGGSQVQLSNSVIAVGLVATNAGLGVIQVGLAATNAAIDAALAITNVVPTGSTGSKVGRQYFLTNGASSTSWKTRGITNSVEGFAIFQPANLGVTSAWAVSTLTTLHCMGTNPAIGGNIIFDSGTNYGFTATTGFVNKLNHTWSMAAGWMEISGFLSDANNPANAGVRDIYLYVNGQGPTNAFGIYPAVPDFPGYSQWGNLFQGGNVSAGNEQVWGPLHALIYNPSPTNIFSLVGYQTAGAGLDCFALNWQCIYLGDHL